jgi:hypothetical protein
MAIGPLVAITMGALGVIIYLISPKHRNKETSRFLLYYLLSILSMWTLFTIQASLDNFILKVIGIILGLGGIYGFLFFGTALCVTIMSRKANLNLKASPDNIEEVKTEVKPIISDNIYGKKKNKGKNWYIVGEKVYDKLSFYEGYLFEKSLDGRKITTYKSDNEVFGFSIDWSDVDIINYEGERAIIVCPNCSQKCRCLILEIIEITCPSCNQVWKQRLDVSKS